MSTQTNEITCQYDLKEMPNNKKWSNKKVPTIGQRVFVNMNQLGMGTVESYFFEHGYAGVCVKLENPPKWKVEQDKHPDNPKWKGKALVFGSEIVFD
jgi:hypothetical protein